MGCGLRDSGFADWFGDFGCVTSLPGPSDTLVKRCRLSPSGVVRTRGWRSVCECAGHTRNWNCAELDWGVGDEEDAPEKDWGGAGGAPLGEEVGGTVEDGWGVP